jgi:hypothetical protein
MNYAGVMLLITAVQREFLSILTIVLYRIDKWLFKYGHIKTFIYIIVCTLNAFVFVILLQYLFRFFSQGYLQYINFTDFSVTIRAESRTEDYELRELLYFERHHAGEISDYRGLPQAILYNGNSVNGMRVLSCRKMFYRVLGEDIDIACSIKIYRTNPTRSFCKWIKKYPILILTVKKLIVYLTHKLISLSKSSGFSDLIIWSE